ncbi:uncharacterized protein LOC112045962 [Bicyclus anynana]|uniref:Uncharacterized protein LOC112045962 n=1 Tax=Bicyclus anynana TaxID=110368 RepID=A0A6J1MZ03_BICAN|nr:uncharacterized protein LOC112045962 [Bicyclus anynana]
MIFHQNLEVPFSFAIYLLVKIVCAFVRFPMHNKPTLTSIPERSEIDENEEKKWVSKKKHDVLKAKYRCLKKLFQMYDASVIGILPETYSQETQASLEDNQKVQKQNKRDIADASALTDFDVTYDEKPEITVLKDLNLDVSSEKIPNHKSKTTIPKDNKSTQDSKDNLLIEYEKDVEIRHRVPYLVINEKRKPTRFQNFIQRCLGICQERNHVAMSYEHAYAASDNIISNRYEKRRRRGLRFRRIRRTKKSYSEIALGDAKSPIILSYVQSVQKNCLMDKTPRHCPIVGCNMILYGIINYNDHINLCHLPERVCVCVYCHEGFPRDADRLTHENEHIGLTKLTVAPSTPRFSPKIASITQTEPEMPKIPEDKLKKIVSFFDKISDPEQIAAELTKNTNKLQTLHINPRSGSASLSGSEDSNSDKIVYKTRSRVTSIVDSDTTSKYPGVPFRCVMCGDNFNTRGQLNLHIDLQHRVSDKFSKYNSCAGILNHSNQNGSINVESTNQSLNKSLVSTNISKTSNLTKLSKRKSNETLSYDPSTNIVYYTSTESMKKPSFVQKVRSGFFYKWEPGTKIIRV